MHWRESDNLETMLKSTSIHNTERLTHFLTSQLEYVDGLHCVVDLFPKRAAHMIPTSKFHLSDKEETSYFVFLELCIEKESQLHITLACDDKVKALAQSNDIDNTSINPFQLTQQKCMPCEKILKREDNFPQTSTVYLRMEKLCSNDLNDIRKLLDLTATDYSLNELSYLPTVAFSPLLFASELINRAKISGNDKPDEMTPQSPYFVQWGFVKFPKDNSKRQSTASRVMFWSDGRPGLNEAPKEGSICMYVCIYVCILNSITSTDTLVRTHHQCRYANINLILHCWFPAIPFDLFKSHRK